MNSLTFPPTRAPDPVALAAKSWLAAYRRRERIAPWMNEGAWRMLLVLAAADGIDKTSVTHGASLSFPTAHRLMLLMQGEGLIRITDHPESKRSRLVWLTDAGRTIIEQVNG